MTDNRQLAARARSLADDAMRSRRAALCLSVLLDSTRTVAAARELLAEVDPNLRPLASQLLDQAEAANAPDYWMGTQLLRDLWPESRPEMYVPAPNPSVEVSSGSPSDEPDSRDEHPLMRPYVHLGSTPEPCGECGWPVGSIACTHTPEAT